MQKNLKGTWRQAILTFFGPVLLVFSFRFFVLEPFVIPSGSMLPNLLIHDHLMVLKGSFGIKSPFSETWWLQWATPQRGDIVVFRYPENPKVFYIKRVIGLPGDKIIYKNHRLTINGKTLDLENWTGPSPLEDEDFDLFVEKGFTKSYFIRHFRNENSSDLETQIEVSVPEKKYFIPAFA